jgi:predicted phosphodiesterase
VVKFGAFSCAHLCSRQQQLTHLEAFYTRCEDEGIADVFCTGDVTDGDGKVYKGHTFDTFITGADHQLDYVAAYYPKRDNITTHMIAGNHDWSFWQRGGYDFLKALASRRKDIRYHGAYGAKIMYGGIHIYMGHGDGGSSYARSYKPQRRIEQFAPEEKPEIFLLGHYHVWDHLPMYRNVVSFQLGCFQSQTDYLKRKGLYPELGGLILTVYKGTKAADRAGGFVRVVDEVVPFYKPRERDY